MPAVAAPPNMARPADPYQPIIGIDLEYSQLWKSFHEIGTEMVITKTGRRMFPYCNIRLSGLLPYAKYVIMVDVLPVDHFKYKWSNEQWEVAGKAEPQPPCRTYVHPDSPAPGSHWMKQTISFLKLKLTNNPLDQRGHIILQSMHRYQPRFHVVQADDLYKVRWSVFQTFTFPETIFTAVTVYQNNKITKLKIDHNPFAKGFREEGTHSKRHRAQKSLQSSESSTKKQKTTESEPEFMCYSEMPRLSYDPRRDDSDSMLLPKSIQDEHVSPWGGEQDPSQNLLSEGSMDYSNSEQLVPGQASYQPNRSRNQFAKLPSPSCSDGPSDCHSFDPKLGDMATVPDPELPRALASFSISSSQSEAPDFSTNSKPRSGFITDHQPSSHWSGVLPGQYPSQTYPTAHPHPHLPIHPHPHHLISEHSLHPSGYHLANAVNPEWSQYSLFSYTC